jgi:hypothetical protein
MNAVIGDETFFVGKVEKCPVGDAGLFGRLTGVCGPCIL